MNYVRGSDQTPIMNVGGNVYQYFCLASILRKHILSNLILIGPFCRPCYGEQ